MLYDVTYFDFDRSDNEMKDGYHSDVEAMGAIDAVLKFIKSWDEYPDGTQGREQYLAIAEVNAGSDDFSVAAYRKSESEWEVHVRFDSEDEAFTLSM